MKITISDTRLSVQTTKNDLYFQVAVRVDQEHATAAGLSHTGMAFAVVSRDELKALMEVGFKPFAKATLTGDFREEPNKDPAKQSLLKFDIDSVEFNGGCGNWDSFLDKELTNASKDEAPRGF